MSNSSFIVTMPKDWADFNGLIKGEELEFEELGNDLLIKGKESKKIDLDINVSNLSLDLIWRNLVCAYRKGANKVTVKYSNEEELRLIKQFIPDFIGWAVVEMDKDKVVIKDIIPLENDDFNKTLEKVILLVVDISEKVYTGFKKQDKDILKNIPYFDYNLNKFCNLCLRILNLKGLKYEKTNSLYKIISILEEIGDQYRAIAIFSKPIKLSDELMNLFTLVNKMLREFYDLFYNFDKKRLREFYEKAEVILNEFKKFKRSNSTETEIYATLFSVLHMVKSLSEENLVISL